MTVPLSIAFQRSSAVGFGVIVFNFTNGAATIAASAPKSRLPNVLRSISYGIIHFSKAHRVGSAPTAQTVLSRFSRRLPFL